MNRYFILAGLLVLATLANAKSLDNAAPTSALEYQQTTDTRIAIEAGFIRFFTAGEEQLVINSNGRVGLGISSPTTNLDIKGNVRIGTDDEHVLQITDDAANNQMLLSTSQRTQNATPRNILFRSYGSSSNSNLLFMDAVSGKIGIGTTSPANLLDVRIGSSSGWTARFAETNGAGIILGVDPFGDDALSGFIAHTSSNRNLKYWVAGTGKHLFYTSNVAAMSIDNNGRVGIGTTSPTAKLDIKTSSGSLKFDALGASSAKITSTAALGLEANGTSFIQFLTGGNEIGRFTNEGKFGIGTTDPEYDLDVVGTIQTDYLRLNAQNGATEGGEIKLDGAASFNDWRIDNYSGHLRAHHSGTVKFIVSSNGQVGIGTTSPSHALHVVGNIHGSTYSASSPPSWPDYVFEESYELNDLKEVEKFIASNHHLPEIPSEAEVKKNGVDIVDMQAKLLQKIEELTLYVIEQNKKIEAQQKEIDLLKTK